MKKKTIGQRHSDGKYKYVTASRMHKGKQIKVYAASKKQAKEKLQAKMEEIIASEYSPGLAKSTITVRKIGERFIDDWVNSKTRDQNSDKVKDTISVKSADMYKTKLTKYVYPNLGNTLVSDVTPSCLQALVNRAVKDGGLAQKTCRDLILVIQKLFEFAEYEGYVSRDPSRKLELRGTERIKRRSLTQEEQELILNYSGTNRDADMFRLQMLLGFRDAEGCVLKVKNIDLKDGLVYIDQAIQSGTQRVVGKPKSDHGIRVIPIDLKADSILRRVVEGKEDDDYLFLNKSGNLLTVTEYYRRWRAFWRDVDILQGAEMTKSGHIYDPKDLDINGVVLYPDKNGNPRNGHKVAQDITPHHLRHTFATNLARAGIPDEIRKAIMGHENIKTTQEYTHIDESKKLREDALIARAILINRISD